MNVVITKDAYGVEVWKEGTKLVYEKPFTKVLVSRPSYEDDPSSTMNVDSDEAWLTKGWPFGKKIYNSSEVKKMFPSLISKLKIGDKVEGELVINIK